MTDWACVTSRQQRAVLLPLHVRGKMPAAMIGAGVLLKFLEKTFFSRVLLLFLLYSLLPLSEIVLILYMGGMLGKYLTLACAATTGLLGVLMAATQFRKELHELRLKVKEGIYPGREFMSLAGIFVGGLLLLTPGFITDFFGFLLFIPVIRTFVGGLITRRMEKRLKEVYEYLKLYEY